jgi:hypothetical protein
MEDAERDKKPEELEKKEVKIIRRTQEEGINK